MVALGRAAVDDGLLLGGELAAAHELLTQREKELGLEHHRVLPVAVTLLHVHGVDVVGRGGGDIDHLAAQPFNDGPVLRFRVDTNNIVAGGQGQRRQLPLGGEGLAGAGDAQNKPVAVEQLLPVGQDEVPADDILSIVYATLVADLLGLEGHEHGQGLGGEGAQGADPPQAQGQSRDEAVRLLPAQRGELAQVFPGDGLEGLRVAVQLLLTVRQMYQRHHGEQHPLVAGGQVVQHLAGLLPLLLQVIGYNGGEVVVAVLPALPVGHVCLHPQQAVLQLPHGLVGGHGDDVDGQHQISV